MKKWQIWLTAPTNDLVAAKIADLEGGVAAVLTSSGQSAIFYSIFNICEAGDHVICASAIYGGTLNVLGVTAKKMGIECTFVDVDAPAEELEKAFKPNTKAVIAETIANPSLVVLDIEKMANLAHSHGVPLVVDNTFATPVNCQPFKWGADIVVHSTTKYMDGHAAQVGGAIVDSGNFDWEAHADKFPGLTTPDESYHGVVYTKQFGKAAYITKINAQLMRDLGSVPSPMNSFILNLGTPDESYHGVVYTKQFGKAAYITKINAQLMRDLGSVPSPMNSFILNLGLESLVLRVERHCYNAQKVAEYLDAHPLVGKVNYPGLPQDKYHDLAQKYMPKGTCGVISFELKKGREAAVKFMDSLKLASIVTHVADAKTSVLQKYMPKGTCGVISFELKKGREAAVKFMDSLKLASIVTHVADAKTSVLHPASHTHRQLNDEQLVAAGVSPGMIRFSVGIEHIDDIIADLSQALEASEK